MQFNVTIQVYERQRLVDEYTTSNKVTLYGVDTMVELLQDRGYSPAYCGFGTDGTATTEQQQWLGGEVFRNAWARRWVYFGSVQYQITVLTTQANGNTLREAGMFVAANAPFTTAVAGYSTLQDTGILFARTVLVPFAKTASNSLTLKWDLNLQSL
jgi:hypothetical protein